eukprot:TRINITY_DN37119_c0_g1_i2.p1 TRINITY_DN37119_c0_g1~~TRINITY_DN37119_c0_g1_i2.p1  ORF type:complete len:356 (+),score=100.80 TRINITY_DN37119_c0_g1_i2:128-1195(+)
MKFDAGSLMSFAQEVAPDSIAGIDIPKIDADSIGQLAQMAADVASGDFDMIGKGMKVKEVLVSGARSAGDCYGVIDTAVDVLKRIAENMAPLMPILTLDPGCRSMINKETMTQLSALIRSVLDVGSLLNRIMGLLGGVTDIFNSLKDVCGDMFDFVAEVMGDIANAFKEALNLSSVVDGISGLFDGIKWVIGELTFCDGVMRPLLDAWDEGSAADAAAHIAKIWREITDVIRRFLPSWEKAQSMFGDAIGWGKKCWDAVKESLEKFVPFVTEMVGKLGIDMPDGLCDMASAAPTILGRGLDAAPFAAAPVPEISQVAQGFCFVADKVEDVIDTGMNGDGGVAGARECLSGAQAVC